MTRKYNRKVFTPVRSKEPLVRALFRHMELNGHKISDVAERAGVSADILSKWRSGLHSPRLDLFVAVCESCGMSLSAMSNTKRHTANAQQMELEL